MSFKASTILARASVILQDPEYIRWPLPELCDWLNEAQRTVVTIKPNALAATVVIDLAAGTRQVLPASVSVFTAATCNMVSGQRSAVIQSLGRRETLDAAIPGWNDSSVLPFSPKVAYAWQDASTPREFYVVPGNDGTGHIEAVVGLVPTDIPIPTNMGVIDAYTTVSQFTDEYQSILLDLTLARALLKDAETAADAQRAGQHLQLASQALGALGASQASSMLSNVYAPSAPG